MLLSSSMGATLGSLTPTPTTPSEGSQATLTIAVNYGSSEPRGVSGTVQWGDGTSSTFSGSINATPTHTYANNGNFTASLTGTAVEWGITGSQYVIDGYNWLGSSYGHTEYTYGLIASPISGSLGISVANVVPVIQSVSVLGVTEATASLDFTAEVTDAGINDTIASYAWDFDNDGTADASGKQASHVFASTGEYDVKVTATDNDGGVSAVFVKHITVTALQAPEFRSPTSVEGIISHGFTYTFVANRHPSLYTLHGTLPTGVTFDSATGVLSGVPTKLGTFPLTITAENEIGSNEQNFSLLIKPIAGSYSGLIPSATNSFADSGNLTLTFTRGGAYSAKAIIGGRRFSTRGRFDPTGASAPILSKLAGAPTLSLVYDQTDLSTLTGTVTIGGSPILSVLQHTSFQTLANPAPLAGSYTIVLPHPTDASLPRGHGFGTATIATNGTIKFLGTLGDGTRVSQSGLLADNSTWAFFALAYKNKGEMLGKVTFQNQISTDLDGQLLWIKPESTVLNAVHPAAFTSNINLAGARYTRPTTVPTLIKFLDLTAGTINFDIDGTGFFPLSKSITIEDNKIKGPTTSELSMSLVTANGRFTGKFFNLETRAAAPISGVVNQKTARAFGIFKSVDKTGFIELVP